MDEVIRLRNDSEITCIIAIIAAYVGHSLDKGNDLIYIFFS